MVGIVAGVGMAWAHGDAVPIASCGIRRTAIARAACARILCCAAVRDGISRGNLACSISRCVCFVVGKEKPT